jgi:hypothetical protein
MRSCNERTSTTHFLQVYSSIYLIFGGLSGKKAVFLTRKKARLLRFDTKRCWRATFFFFCFRFGLAATLPLPHCHCHTATLPHPLPHCHTATVTVPLTNAICSLKIKWSVFSPFFHFFFPHHGPKNTEFNTQNAYLTNLTPQNAI